MKEKIIFSFYPNIRSNFDDIWGNKIISVAFR